ncbi:MAG: hypothetical protein WCV92_00070 [Candidatus Buchananbacteria bacterium]
MAKEKNTAEERIWGAASYLWVLSLVVLAARKDDEYVRFHANQGVFLFIISLIMIFIPILGWIINVIILIFCIVGLVKSLKGERWQLPLVSDIAQKFGDWIVKTIKL